MFKPTGITASDDYSFIINSTFQLYRGGQFNWWRKPKYTEKTDATLCDQVCQ
jgi:hypothetical protein